MIVGCGYTGTYLARALLARGTTVWLTRRSLVDARRLSDQLLAEFPNAKVSSLDYDTTDPLTRCAPPGTAVADKDIRAIVEKSENGRLSARSVSWKHTVVVMSAPPGNHPAEEIAALPVSKKLVYLSSTGVYGRGHGAIVDETWPTEPLSPTGIARLAAEDALRDRTEPTVALRIAGIHGPGRGIIDRIKAGTYRIVGDGSAHVSRIHVEDLVRAIIAAGDSDITGPINIADDDPAPIGLVADTIAKHLGVSLPVRTPVDQVTPEVAAMLTADRRISNARMKSLGVTLAYPSWRSMIETGTRV
ncbi:hypothetical protein BH11MYX2_BH11MYX2_37680 [soil metagenome]